LQYIEANMSVMLLTYKIVYISETVQFLLVFTNKRTSHNVIYQSRYIQGDQWECVESK